MKKSIKKKKGISLIVLVITIIVIIILAVAVILSISNNNPIENARKARFLNDLKTIQEEVTLHIGTQYANDPEKYNPSTDTGIQKIVDKYTDYNGKIQVVDGKVMLVDDETKVSEQEKLWAEEVGIKVKEELPTIPVGFSYKEGTVNTGYVIINDTDDNEFVWVPVEVSEGKTFEEVFIRESFTSSTLSSSYTEPYSFYGTTTDASEIAEYNAMMASVEKYKGFYIARYEASNNGSGVAQSKKDQPSWENIPWGTSMTDLSGGAVEKARAVYPNSDKAEDSKYAVSTLCYGVQWDATIRWLKKNYPTITEDSSEYGNYFNATFKYIDTDGTIKTKEKDTSTQIPTGSSEHNKTNNIYDMCGNLVEWTMEALYGNGRILRGVNYMGSGTNGPVSFRNYSGPDLNPDQNGFRFALYIK